MALNRYRGNFAPMQGEVIVATAQRSFRHKQHVDNVTLAVKDISHPSDQTEKCKNFEASGKLFLTNRGLAWIGKPDKKLTSFSCSFGSISRFELKQPVLGANYIRGQTKGEPGEFGFKGTVDWRLTFMDGGAVDWGKALIATQKNPPSASATVMQPVGIYMGGSTVGVQQADGSFYFPPGSFPQMPSVPPSYNQQNYVGGDRPPQYGAPSSSAPLPPAGVYGQMPQYPPQPQYGQQPQYPQQSQQYQQPQYPGSGGSKANEAGFR